MLYFTGYPSADMDLAQTREVNRQGQRNSTLDQLTYIAFLCLHATVCSIGKYGAGCSSNCSGHCIGDEHRCSHTDGSYSEGCEAGYIILNVLNERLLVGKPGYRSPYYC